MPGVARKDHGRHINATGSCVATETTATDAVGDCNPAKIPLMVELLVAFAVAQHQASFKISHHAKLSDCILQAFDVRRDGTLVGSYGQLGLHDGWEHPLIVIKGTQIVPANEAQLGGY